MKTSGRVLCLALLAVILSAGMASAARQAASGSMQDKDSAAIAAAVQNYMDSWNTHNVHAVAAI
jgi:hypothetical protein